MSDLSIRETIEFDDGTPSLISRANEYVDDATDSDNQTEVESDHLVQLPRPGDYDDDSFGEDFDHSDSGSPSPSPEANESVPAESDSRTLAESHDSPSAKSSRLTQLFSNFADEFLDIVEEDAQEAVIAAARAQNTDLCQQVKKNNHEIGRLTDEFYDHVSGNDKRAKAESEKLRGEMKSLKRSINKRDQSNSAFQNDVSDRFASLEQSVTDRLLLMEKIISSRMTRLEKSINGRFDRLGQGMDDRFAALDGSID